MARLLDLSRSRCLACTPGTGLKAQRTPHELRGALVLLMASLLLTSAPMLNAENQQVRAHFEEEVSWS